MCSFNFLLFVRYGIIDPNDPLIVDSLKVVDKILKVDTPYGPSWRRFNNDWYGQREDGSAYKGVGMGRAWPLLTGERAEYELAAGHDVAPFIKAMEGFATDTGLLTEQVWDSEDIPEAHMYLGKPTGAAMPLMWAHAEYIKLLRSAQDGRMFDLIDEVSDRYLGNYHSQPIEVWKFHRQVTKIEKGTILRIQADKPFKLLWSNDNWDSKQEIESTNVAELSLDYVDLESDKLTPIEFTFFWNDSNNWEQGNYTVEVV